MIRHAESEGNIYRRAHGQFDGFIIGRGFQQIERLRERFKDESINAVYSSDLSRTCTTAAAIYEPRGLPLNKTERLREVNMGAWEDEPWGNFEYYQPDMVRYFGSDPARWRIAGSEAYEHVKERMMGCMLDIARAHIGESVAVFSHGFAIRAFLCEVLGIPSHDAVKLPYCDNTAVALLRFENGGLSVDYHSDNSHLHKEISTFANQTWWRGENERVSENMRFMPLDTGRDGELMNRCEREMGAELWADTAFTAFLADEPAGLVGLDAGGGDGAVTRDAGGGTGRISYIYIKPELRRRNYGVQLLGQAVSVYRRLRRETLQIETVGGSPYNNFFLKFGFVKIGGHDSTDIMEKNIRNW